MKFAVDIYDPLKMNANDLDLSISFFHLQIFLIGHSVNFHLSVFRFAHLAHNHNLTPKKNFNSYILVRLVSLVRLVRLN